MYSVIPKKFFFKKCFLDTGPFINVFASPVLISFKPSLKQFSIYFDDLVEILSNVFLKLKFTSKILI